MDEDIATADPAQEDKINRLIEKGKQVMREVPFLMLGTFIRRRCLAVQSV